MIKVRTKGPFRTKANRVISRGEGQIIMMGEEDYEEVSDLCEVLDKPKKKKEIEEIKPEVEEG